MKTAKLLLPVFLCAASGAMAQAPIEVMSTSQDTVGKRLTFNLRETITRSRQFATTLSDEAPRMRVYLVTLDPDAASRDANFVTVYSATFVWHFPASDLGFYLTNVVERALVHL